MTKSQTKDELLTNLLKALEYRRNEKNFWADYEIIRDKVNTTIECFYTNIEIHKYAKEDNSIYKKLNQHPTFWNITLYSLQSAFFMSLGKIFDDGPDTLSIHKILTNCVEHPEYFSKNALAARKIDNGLSPSDVSEYLKSAYEPTTAELRILKKSLTPYRKLFEANYKDIRNLIFGHIILKDKTDISKLFSKTNIEEIGRILYFLYNILENIWQLYQNGKKPSLGSTKFDLTDRIETTTKSFIDTLK